MYGFQNHEELRKYQKDRRDFYEKTSLSPEDSKSLLLHLLGELDRLEGVVLSQERNFKEIMGMNSSNQYSQNTVYNGFNNQSQTTDFEEAVAMRVREILNGSPLTEEEKNGPFHYTPAPGHQEK